MYYLTRILRYLLNGILSGMTRNQIPKTNAISRSTENAHIFNEWHPTKNVDINPDRIATGSMQKIWWQCSTNPNHSWDMTVYARVTLHQNCPYCSGKRTDTSRNDLASQFPTVAAEWDYETNAKNPKLVGLDPTTVATGSNKIAAWIGTECNHKWNAIIQSRTKAGSSCPYCTNRKVLKGFNDLASSTQHAEIVAEWHEDNELKPDEVGVASNKSVKWRCSAEPTHVWKAYINNRTKRGSGCPECYRAGKTPKRKVSYIKDVPELAAEYHPTKNTEPLESIRTGSGKTLWWLCSEGHEWTAVVSNRVRGSACSVCIGRKVVAGVNDLASHPEYARLVSEWHPDNKLAPSEVLATSDRKYKWVCTEGHEWVTSIYARIRFSQNCPECAGRTGDVLVMVSEVPELMAEWHSDNTLDPNTVASRGAKKVKWQCLKNSLHVWESTPSGRTLRGYGCPVCAGHKVITGVNDLASDPRYIKLVQEWHEDNVLTPQEVTVYSNRPMKWRCSVDTDHIWTASIATRSKHGHGCPRCAAALRVSKAEQEIADLLMSVGIQVQQSSWGLIARRELDIYLPDYRFAIEYNGVYWHSSAVRDEPDYHLNKWTACKQKGITLYQVWEDDWAVKKEAIMADILSQLGLAGRFSEMFPEASEKRWGEELKTDSLLGVSKLSEVEAEDFFGIVRLGWNPVVLGSHHFGLRDTEGGVRAALSVQKTNDEGLWRIVQFGALGGSAFEVLLGSAQRALPMVLQWETDVNLERGLSHEIFQHRNFVISDMQTPRRYFVRNEKRFQTISIEEFRSDKTLLFEEGLSVMKLAVLNGFSTVWDTGSYYYTRFVG